MKNKKVIYTAIINRYDELQEPTVMVEGWDYICITDVLDLKSDNWKVVHVKRDCDAVLFARKVKILFHHYVGDYDTVIWLDANIQIRCDIGKFVKQNHKKPLSLMEHPTSKNSVDEASLCIKFSKVSHQEATRQIEFYGMVGYKFDNGQVATGLMIRDNCPEVIEFCEDWYKQILEFTPRDQLSFNYVAWKTDLPFHTFSFENILSIDKFHYLKHKRIKKKNEKINL